jgi:hypothetical protein
MSYRKSAVKRDESRAPQITARPSALIDTRVIYCGDNLEENSSNQSCYFFALRGSSTGLT